MNIERHIAKLLIKNKETLSVAESCTGGLLSNSLTNIPGSSKFFVLGIIPYDNKFKTLLLNIPKNLLRRQGAVSEKTALVMAENIRRLAGTSFGLSITGIAGPVRNNPRQVDTISNGATKTKPVGLIYIGLSSKEKSICKKFMFKGNRLSIKKQATDAAINLLIKNLCGH